MFFYRCLFENSGIAFKVNLHFGSADRQRYGDELDKVLAVAYIKGDVFLERMRTWKPKKL